jgi:hypothetical protein
MEFFLVPFQKGRCTLQMPDSGKKFKTLIRFFLPNELCFKAGGATL